MERNVPLQNVTEGYGPAVPEPIELEGSSALNSIENGFDPMYSEPFIEGEYFDSPEYSADCGFGCPPGWYTIAEALYATRDGERTSSLSRDIRLDTFGYEQGGRATFGRKNDCLDGWEVSVLGVEFEEQGMANGVGLDVRFAGGPGVNISAFTGAVQHQEIYETKFMSAELNRKWWGWDVFSSTLGLRYMRNEERFLLNSLAPNGDIGRLDFSTINDLWGAHCGFDMIYPIGRFSFSAKARLGLFANLTNSDLQVVNATIPQISSGGDTTEIGALIEVGYYMTYQLLPQVRLRAGYEFWYVYGVTIATEQPIFPLVPASARSLRTSGEVFLHGGTVGVEAIW